MSMANPEVIEFADALHASASLYRIALSDHASSRLQAYYAEVLRWNPRLHLVAPCAPPEFATRHVLESLVALPYLNRGASVADVGSGAGLPIIPCLVMRPDMRAALIEASRKKAVFLRHALRAAEADQQAEVVAERFERLPAPEVDIVTCRALDRFSSMLPKLVEWSPKSATLLLFVGESLRRTLAELDLSFVSEQLPGSERRYLCIVPPRSEPPATAQWS